MIAVLLVGGMVFAGGKYLGGTEQTEQTEQLEEKQQNMTIRQFDSDEEQSEEEEQSVKEEAEEAQDPDDPAIIGKAGGDSAAVSKTGGSKSGEQDQYHTDPVPEGRPEPVEPDEEEVDTDTSLTCTISISCDTILDNMDECKENKRSLVPSDGVILPATEVTFSSGESVYDILQSVCKENRIHMESKFTPMYNSAYIQGINNIYEFDVGNESGWMYEVNGWFPNYGCSRYQVQDGDVINWVYTCDLGSDVGDNSMSD